MGVITSVSQKLLDEVDKSKIIDYLNNTINLDCIHTRQQQIENVHVH